MKKLNDRGFAHAILAVLIVAVVAVAGFAGYAVMHHNKSKAGSLDTLGMNVCGRGYTWFSTGMSGGGNVASYGKNGVNGFAEVFRNHSNNTACLVNFSQDKGYGISKFMYATMTIAKTNNPNSPLVTPLTDKGQYKRYAGPVYLTIPKQYNNTNYCIDFYGGISYGSTITGFDQCFSIAPY